EPVGAAVSTLAVLLAPGEDAPFLEVLHPTRHGRDRALALCRQLLLAREAFALLIGIVREHEQDGLASGIADLLLHRPCHRLEAHSTSPGGGTARSLRLRRA